MNLSNENFVIEDGERIFQMMIATYIKAEWERVDKLLDKERGISGFGNTGK